MKLDMHCHTIWSDGVNTRDEIIADAKDKWLEALFITDHDRVSLDHVDAIMKAWLTTGPSVEITTVDHERVVRDVHMTYYAHTFSDELLSVLDHTRDTKREQIMTQLEHLQELGFYINVNEFYNFCDWEWISYYNIAQYIVSKPENIWKLQELWCYQDWKKPQSIFYNKCLKKGGDLYAVYGADCNESYKPQLRDIVEMTRDTWILSFAHPNYTFDRAGIRWFTEMYQDFYLPQMWLRTIEINTRASKKWVDAILWVQGNTSDTQLTFWSDCHRLWKPDDKHWDLWFENRFLDEETIRREFWDFRDKLWI